MSDDRMAALEARLSTLEAILAIQRMQADYVRAVADRQFDDLANWFTEDAVIDMRTHGAKSGHAAIAEHFEAMVNTPLEGATYVLSSPSIEMTSADTADGTWTWHRMHSTLQLIGRTIPAWGVWEEGKYLCSYRRVGNGDWRFSAMRFRMVRPTPDETPAE